MRKRIIENMRVSKSDGCWLWVGTIHKTGYGTFSFWENNKRRTRRVHRVAYEQEIGPIPDGMLVCHKCDVRNCIRPDHLFLGTQKENVADMDSKGRRRLQPKTHCKRGHLFTKVRRDNRGRFCPICAGINHKNFLLRKRQNQEAR